MLKTLKPRLAEVGKIKIGGKGATREGKNGTWRLPEKRDDFIVTTLERDAKGDLKPDAALMATLLEKYGADDGGKRKLREIPIALLSDNIDEVLVANYCRYEGRTLHARCDGETETWFVGKDGPLKEPKTRPCDGKHEKPWKLHATFSCVIAEGGARWGGVYKFRTTSQISAEQLLGTLQHVQLLTGGILQAVPLRLVVRPMEVAPEGKATVVHVVHVELRGTDLAAVQQQALQAATVRIQHAQQLAAVRRDYLALLAAPESPEEQADIAEEFDPGEHNAEPAEEKPVETAAVEVKPETEPKQRVTEHKTASGRKIKIVDVEAEKPAQKAPAEKTAAPKNAAPSAAALDEVPF